MDAEGDGHGLQVVDGGRLVDRDHDAVAVDRVDVHAFVERARHDLACARPGTSAAHRVEDVVVCELDPTAQKVRGQGRRRERSHPSRDPLEPVGPVVHRVHRGNDCEEHLRSADVARRLLTADVLLASLSATRSATRPASSRRRPRASRPGSERAFADFVPMNPACGPPAIRGMLLGSVIVGGPHAGFIGTKSANARSLPGRLVGVSRDDAGRVALRLALQTASSTSAVRRRRATSALRRCCSPSLPRCTRCTTGPTGSSGSRRGCERWRRPWPRTF